LCSPQRLSFSIEKWCVCVYIAKKVLNVYILCVHCVHAVFPFWRTDRNQSHFTRCSLRIHAIVSHILPVDAQPITYKHTQTHTNPYTHSLSHTHTKPRGKAPPQLLTPLPITSDVVVMATTRHQSGLDYSDELLAHLVHTSMHLFCSSAQ
jgi:hypothetical protein